MLAAARARFGHAEFGQYAKGGLGMKESDELPSRSVERLFVNEFNARLRRLFQLRFDIVTPERDVMNPSVWVLFQELGDGAFRIGRLKQFKMDLTHREESGADLLGFDFFAMLAFEAECLFVVRDSFVQRPHCDSKVINFLKHGIPD